ncbi:MAG TPA: PIN domain-containing protein [Gaiellaceae bacterium]|nr:PIN domain-containing protein [Gaiellaceae bacterium]
MVILDSSFLVAYHNTRDVHHEVATGGMERLVAGEWGRALLLEYVFLEVATVLLARRGLETASRVATVLLEAREVDFVPCSELFVETLEAFRLQSDRGWSFTDAAIVTVVRRAEGITSVATFDTGFREIEGLAVVPDSLE